MTMQNGNPAAGAAAGSAPPPEGGASPGSTPSQAHPGEPGGQPDSVEYWKSEAKKAFAARDEYKSRLAQTPEFQAIAKERDAAQQRLAELEAARKQAEDAEAAKRGEYEKLYGKTKEELDRVASTLSEKEKAYEAAIATQKADFKRGMAKRALTSAYQSAEGVDQDLFMATAAKYLDDGSIKVDDEYNVTGVEEVLQKVREAKPILFKPGSAARVATPGAGVRSAPADPVRPNPNRGGVGSVASGTGRKPEEIRADWETLKRRQA